MQENITVLIVEDEDVWARNLQLNLHDFGFSIAGVISTTEGALYAFENTKFDVVLLDIHLEKRNSGIELGKMLHTEYQKPFIFVTGSYDTHSRIEAVEARPSAYLTKPVNSASLFVAIQNAIHNFRNQASASVTDSGHENVPSFFIKEGNDYKRIDWSDIVYLSSSIGRTVAFSSKDHTEYPIRSSLHNTLRYIIPAQLQHSFIQVSGHEAVQLKYISEVKGNKVVTEFKTFDVDNEYLVLIKNALDVLAG